MIKKYWPILIFIIGILLFAGLYFFVIRDGSSGDSMLDEEENVPEIPLEMRPVTMLTPSDDGHWLKLEIKDIKVDAVSLDYELLYQTKDGLTQGVPGTVKLDNATDAERDLLLGSESSGKFRYDEGVETGTLTLRFRNSKGKLVGKLSTEFHLQNGDDELTSADGMFTYELNRSADDTYFVTMETFGLPDKAPGSVSKGPYGVFGSDSGHPGTVDLSGSIYMWNGTSWEQLSGGSSDSIGIFVSTSE